MNQVVDHVPATTAVLLAGNEVGSTWLGALDKLGDQPGLKDALGAIDSATGVFGGMDAILGWIGDAGFVVNVTGTQVEEGFVVVPTDSGKASSLFGTLKTFISLGGGAVGLSVSEETYGDATITNVSVDLTKLGAVAGGLSGGSADGLAIARGDLRIRVRGHERRRRHRDRPRLRQARARHRRRDVPASDAAFDDAVGRVGKDATGVTFVDIESIRTALEALAQPATSSPGTPPTSSPSSSRSSRSPRPSTVGGDLDTLTTIITVK